MIEKTVGIVLRVAPFSRTSHVVVWFTPDFGKITTIVKGALRVKSAFLGQYDLFYRCELLFYSRDRNGAHIMRECSPIDTRTALRHDWRAAVCASYSCDLVSRMAPPNSSSIQFFNLLETSLAFLCTGVKSRSFVSWFELRTMEAAGYSPMLTNCSKCGNPLNAVEAEARFSCASGGAMCRPCADSGADRAMIVTPAALATMQEWQKTDSPERAANTECTLKQLMEIERIFGMFLDYHVQALPTGRSVALELLPQKWHPAAQEHRSPIPR
ncbi:MAG: DNA repair protein RecO [bacterium]